MFVETCHRLQAILEQALVYLFPPIRLSLFYTIPNRWNEEFRENAVILDQFHSRQVKLSVYNDYNDATFTLKHLYAMWKFNT